MKYFFFLFYFVLTAAYSTAQQVPAAYNLKWTKPSLNASESMPVGGGDIGMNVWVEKGELFVYLARSGSFNEQNALLKAGRIRMKFSPNPFEGNLFEQELHLQEGYLTVKAGPNGRDAAIKIWADVFQPVAHIEVTAARKLKVEAAYENWRYQDRLVKPREHWGNSFKWAAPKNSLYKKDNIGFSGNQVLFYHHNAAQTIFDLTVAQQGMDAVKTELYNPLGNLVSGGAFSGSNCKAGPVKEGTYANTDFKSWSLVSKAPSHQFAFQLVLHNAQTADISSWHKTIDSLQRSLAKKPAIKNIQWWKEFWSRSFIQIDFTNPGSTAWEMGRNYQLFRYMLGCNSRGGWPTKFNGGLFTVDPVYTDSAMKLTPDYRNWGGGLHTMQNQRLVYYPMIKNGDWDLLQSHFEFYHRILKNAELRSKVYWNHDGACFTEQMENFGLPNYAEYGQRRPGDFDKGVEYNAWLEYEWDTVLEFCLMMLDEELYSGRDISQHISFIESCLRFFDEHYQWQAKKLGIRALDQHGKLILYPGSAAETFKMAYNSTSTIAALQTITHRLLTLPARYIDTAKRKSWLSFLERIPPLNFQQMNGYTTIAPAKSWQRINNTESPQLYPVFPWGIYGVGKPALDTALNTWNFDTSVVKFRSHVGWKQDNIWAARLGLVDEAWRLNSLKLKNADRRCPAFWGPGFDWVPDHNWGGSGMIGLQEMLMQVDDKKILLFPAWKKDVDVHFKLHAPYQTTVEAELRSGKLVNLTVLPLERKKDVINMLSINN